MLLAGCSSPPVMEDVNGEGFQSGQLLQSNANLVMHDQLDSLSLLLDKLYKRNSHERKKTGATTLEAAHRHVMKAIPEQQPLPDRGNEKSIAAISLTFARISRETALAR